MIIFINDDEAYLRWVDLNSNGWVVNANRRPVPQYLILHRATCAHISSVKRTNWTNKQYIKVCSLDLAELIDWAKKDVRGELSRCGVCEGEQTPVPVASTGVHTLKSPVVSQDSHFALLWQRSQEIVAIDQIEPLKASWEKSTDASQVRLREYRKIICDRLLGHITADNLYLDLHVALTDAKKLLNGNDLENYLTPLFECGCLPSETFRLVCATKTVGGTSRLAVGTAIQQDVSKHLATFSHVSLAPSVKPSSDTEWKRSIQASIASACGEPLPDGEVEIQIAWQCPLSRRNWFRLWKSTGDAMGPILGTYQRKNQYDPKDDRITKLAFHLLPDESLNRSIGLQFWWRMRQVD
jgi:hypothetical protein